MNKASFPSAGASVSLPDGFNVLSTAELTVTHSNADLRNPYVTPDAAGPRRVFHCAMLPSEIL